MVQSQNTYQQSSDPSTVEEILDTEKFIASVRKHFGLTKEQRTICIHCGNQLYQTEDGKCQVCMNKAQGNKQQVWVEKENNLMNKRGVEAFITTLRTNVDRNQIASNFDRKEIKSIMEDFHKKWATEIAREWDGYGVKNKPQAHKIVRDGTNVVWALYKRAQDGDTLDMIGGISKDVSKTVRDQNQDNDGINLGL
jgi:ribosomal protein L37E